MSGGRPSQTESFKEVERAQAQPSHGSEGFARSLCEGLGLDGGWACKAPIKEEAQHAKGLVNYAHGIDAEWPRQIAGSVYESPARIEDMRVRPSEDARRAPKTTRMMVDCSVRQM